MIRTKITLWNTFVICTITTVMSLATYITVKQNQQNSIDESLRERAIVAQKLFNTVPEIAFDEQTHNAMEAMQMLTSTFSDEETAIAGIEMQALPPRMFDRQGTLLTTGFSAIDPIGAKMGAVKRKTVLREVWIEYLPGKKLPFKTITAPLPGEEGRLLQISASLRSGYIELDRLKSLLLFLTPLSWILAILIGKLLTQKVLQPIADVNKAANVLLSDKKWGRLPVKGNDEIAELSKTINVYLGQVEQSYHRIEAFTADASHELKSPLTALLVTLSRDDLAALPPKQLSEVINQAQISTVSMAHLIDDLLFLAKSDQSPSILNPESISLTQILGELSDEFVPKLKDRLILDIDSTLKINGDWRLLKRAFFNLISNSEKHAGPEAIVSVVGRETENEVEITISDNGRGIKQGDLQRIFERWFRSDEARARSENIYEGSGLGLSIVESIVKLHDASIVVQSEIGKGTRFVLTFPKQINTSEHF